jgi:hypothetical protein
MAEKVCKPELELHRVGAKVPLRRPHLLVLAWVGNGLAHSRHPQALPPPEFFLSGPPERLSGFADDIAPGKANVVQVPIAPMRQFAPLTAAVAPNLQHLGEPR